MIGPAADIEYATAERTDDSARMFLAMATRSCAAIRDLGSLELVP